MARAFSIIVSGNFPIDGIAMGLVIGFDMGIQTLNMFSQQKSITKTKMAEFRKLSSGKNGQGTKAVKKKRLARSRYSTDELTALFARFREQRPEPKGELYHINPYTLLVAVVLSAQATDIGVNRATRALFEVADTPEKMVALGEERLREYIKTIGLFRNKAKNVILLSQKLIEEYGSEVPNDRDMLTGLPGVGRKTANVVVSMAFGVPTIAVDTHIFRLGNRMGLAPGRTPDEVEAILEKVIPQEFLYHAHHWLILHGRYTCKARKPECGSCIVADLCKSKEKTAAIAAPIVPIRDQPLPGV
jgi:endonuclease-3